MKSTEEWNTDKEIESLRYDLLHAQAELAETKKKYYDKFGDYENLLSNLIKLEDENKELKSIGKNVRS